MYEYVSCSGEVIKRSEAKGRVSPEPEDSLKTMLLLLTMLNMLYYKILVFYLVKKKKIYIVGTWKLNV